jgi:hypothetical protein
VNNEESTKIPKEMRFAALGRQLADNAMDGKPTAAVVGELAMIRKAEHEVSDKQVAFAGLARQVGDAVASGRDPADLIKRLVELRQYERTGRLAKPAA